MLYRPRAVPAHAIAVLLVTGGPHLRPHRELTVAAVSSVMVTRRPVAYLPDSAISCNSVQL